MLHDCFIILIIFVYILYYEYSNDYNNYLTKIFKELNNLKISICEKNKTITCLDNGIKNNDIKNIFLFISNKIKVNQTISPHYIIEGNKNIIEKRERKIKHMYSVLKLYGFKNVVLSEEGTIHSICWNLTTYGGCKCEYMPKVKYNISLYRQYDKVISISHHWCDSVYHSIGECLPKLGYYIPELLKDSSIKIHTIKSASIRYLHFLGFNATRIIYGKIYVNRLLVLEKGGCGSPPPLIHLNSLRYYLRLKIKSKSKYDIVIIKRIGNREVINFNEVYLTIKEIYREKNIIIFYPNTTFKNTLNYFKYAKLIIAPHGAGMTNMIISNHNCKIVEFFTVNKCYFTLANKLGLDRKSVV